MQAEMEEALVALLNVPAPQGVGFADDSGQYEPMGQMICVEDVDPDGQ
jgi:hypothetical protein